MSEALTRLTGAVKQLAGNTWSPNEGDSNGEPANAVDGLFFLGRCIRALGPDGAALGLGTAILDAARAVTQAQDNLAAVLGSLVKAVQDDADALREVSETLAGLEANQHGADAAVTVVGSGKGT